MSITKISQVVHPFSKPDLANSVFFECLDICYTLDIPVFAALGTALGLYRSGDYLPGDPDIDIFILCSIPIKDALINQLSVSGFAINSIPGAAPSFNVHTVKSRILIDIWFKQRKDFMSFYQGNCYVPFRNRRIRIPFNIEKYLSCVYGDWNTPANTRANCFEPIVSKNLNEVSHG